jgi:hypothetical protein
MEIVENFLSADEVTFCRDLLDRHANPKSVRTILSFDDLEHVGNTIREKLEMRFGPCSFGSNRGMIALMKYQTGQWMPMHRDKGTTDVPCVKRHAITIYLNDDYKGGIFILDNEICPKFNSGSALIYDDQEKSHDLANYVWTKNRTFNLRPSINRTMKDII